MDTRSGYGWISIALHWLTAAIVLALWTIGTMAQAAGREQARPRQFGFDSPHDAVFVDSWRTIPVFGQRALFVALDGRAIGDRMDGWKISADDFLKRIGFSFARR